ncbi:MAG: DUF433 domain-containing protein [Salinibacter sp.]
MANDELPDRIESLPSVMMGKPVVAGTRITVESILEKLAAGESIDDLLEAHPQLERADIRAATRSAPCFEGMSSDSGSESAA